MTHYHVECSAFGGEKRPAAQSKLREGKRTPARGVGTLRVQALGLYFSVLVPQNDQDDLMDDGYGNPHCIERAG